jgi:biopolymer transport protein ExbB/TolQ
LSLFSYLSESSFITIVVLLLLSIYFVATFWIFFYRYGIIKYYISIEKKSLDNIYLGNAISASKRSLLYKYLHRTTLANRAILEAAISDTVRNATKGLTMLSIMASTSPFIGLFGTVVGILETFAKLGKSSSLGVIAPAISEALVATAAGIFVAIFAYSFHLLMKRKAYELNSILKSQAEVIIAQNNEG